MFGTYIPPLSSLSGAANIPSTSRASRVPEDVLTDVVIEEIKTRCCFVGGMVDENVYSIQHVADDDTEPDVPPSEASHAES